MKMSQNPRILIIGAGAAGIAAATRLFENGIEDITILEAENRIGGRICSVNIDNSVVELGAQWVHGEEGNVVYEMVNDMDLLGTSFNDYHSDMNFVGLNIRNLDEYVKTLQDIGLLLLEDKELALKHSGSLGDYFKKAFHEKVVATYPNNNEVVSIAKLVEEWFSKFSLCYDAAESWHDLSTRGAFLFEPCPGDQLMHWRDRGYKTIFDVLMKKIPDISKTLPLDDKILLNKEVTRIDWDGPDRHHVTISCLDGTSYEADHVIVTMSVGALKATHKSLFIPPLPPFKANSIEATALGTVDKILLKFPTRWWDDKTKGFSILWSENDKTNIREEFPNWQPSSNGISWLEDIFGFYVIDSHPNVLLVWVVGKNATAVERLPDDIVKSGCMYVLRKFVGDKYDIVDSDEILSFPVSELLKDFLHDRKQFVCFDGTFSEPKTVTYGVPQGTVLGPLLFTLYVNNIMEMITKGKIISFADDMAIVYQSTSWKLLKNESEEDFRHLLLTVHVLRKQPTEFRTTEY